jgi:uncharacterized damage-inducible protein DinB
MLAVLRTLFRYSSRSTTRLLDAIERLTPEEYVAPGCSGHGSIRDTLAHLLAVEWSWISELDGSMTPAEAEGLTLTGAEISSVAEARRRWVEIDAQTTRCLTVLSEEALLTGWTSYLPGGSTFTLPYWQVLLHVANHGTHTRAQIVAAIRRAGHAPGSYELVGFAIRESAAEGP